MVAEAKTYLPHWATEHLPASTDGLQAAAAKAIQDHAWELQRIGGGPWRITSRQGI